MPTGSTLQGSVESQSEHETIFDDIEVGEIPEPLKKDWVIATVLFILCLVLSPSLLLEDLKRVRRNMRRRSIARKKHA